MTDRTSRTRLLLAHGRSPVQSWLTKASRLIGRKVSVIRGSRKDSDLKRRKRKSHLKRRSIKAALEILADMKVKSPVYQRWSRVCVWIEIWPNSHVKSVLQC